MDMASEEFEMENAVLMRRPKTTDEHTWGIKSHWVVELEEQLKEEVETSGRSKPVIFSVAQAIPDSDKIFYIPCCISVGPYHFGKAGLSSMEPHKIEAVRRMQQRISGRSMQSIVETEIVAMDESIRKFYDKELLHSAIDLAWMTTKDSCFLFEFLLNYKRTRTGYENFLKNCMVEGRYDAVLSQFIINPTWQNILYDLALFENQIPLSILQRLLLIADLKSDPEKIVGDFFSRVCRSDSFLIFRQGMPRPYKKEKTLHFLEVLYYRHVGWDLHAYRGEAYSLNDQRSFHFGWIQSIFSCGWTKSIFTPCCPRSMRSRDGGLRHLFSSFVHFALRILQRLNCVRCKCLGSLPPSNRRVEEPVEPFRLKLPSATELKKKGINLSLVTVTNSMIRDKPQCIQWVQFEEKTSTLYLPEVRIDDFRHALFRNFIALEYTSLKYSPRPITSFALFMDELVDSEEDVAVLREANILKNFFGSNKEAAECFNSLPMSRKNYGGCKPIDDARVGLHKYLRRKYKILWNEFLSTYFAKPWLVAGSVAATVLLLMTLLQVFCLFYTCNRTT